VGSIEEKKVQKSKCKVQNDLRFAFCNLNFEIRRK
jgi:hypothetical protein